MAIDCRLEIMIDDRARAAPEERDVGELRAPNAVWINQPSSKIAPHGRGAKAIIVALAVVALLAAAVMMSREDPLVGPALAGAETDSRA